MVSWQAFPSLPPSAPRPSRFSLALNSTSLLFQTPATQALLQSWNFELYIGGEASKLINFSQCKTNSELDFRLKKDKVSTVFKKPNWNTRWRNIARHIHKQTCLRSDTRWKLLLYLDFRSFFENTGPNCINVPPLLRLPLHDICMRSCSWFTDGKHYFTDDEYNISPSWVKHDSAPKIASRLWNV